MLHALAILLAFQLTGEIASYLLRLPVPGPVIGMALLFAAMAGFPALAERLRETANGLLSHLSLLFVPAGVGVMLHAGRVAQEWLPILAALVLGTAATLAVTALAIRIAAGARDVGEIEPGADA